MKKYSPGPWDFDKDDLGFWLNAYGVPGPIAKICEKKSGQHLVDVQLIACAPELLEALEDCLEMFLNSHFFNNATILKYKKLCAKAKGENENL